MEQKLAGPTKKVFRFLRIILFMIRKNISKTKLSLNLNMIIKRGKIALQNLMLHHQHQHRASPTFTIPAPLTEEYEFSCSNSPVYNYPLSIFTNTEGHDDIFVDPTVIKALEMLTSPVVPGFGKSPTPMVRQLRITDSPFPLSNGQEEDTYVDEAAERFIIKFYNDLRRQG